MHICDKTNRRILPISKFRDQRGPSTNDKGPQILTPKIRCDEVRLIDGDSNDVVSRKDAEAMAEERGLDLVVMSLTSSPPVVKLMDYGKFKFAAEKKAREDKKKQHVVAVKEIKLGIRIDDHDLTVKANRACKFLDAGNKVKCSIRLKGREVQHSDLAFDLAQRFAIAVMESGSLESPVKQENLRSIVFYFQPGKAKETPVVTKPIRRGGGSSSSSEPAYRKPEFRAEPKKAEPAKEAAPVAEQQTVIQPESQPVVEKKPEQKAEPKPAIRTVADEKPDRVVRKTPVLKDEKPAVVQKRTTNPDVQRVKPPSKPAFKPAKPKVSQAALAARPPEKPIFKPASKKDKG